MSTPELIIRPVEERDRAVLWPILKSVVRAGDTYAIDPEISRDDLMHLWCDAPAACLVAEKGEALLGTYYIKTNQAGGGSHVCNCGYITSPAARGQGVAEAMCRHSQAAAVKLGYLAMQFNCVVATNEGAIRLWTRLGYETVGRLPRVFRHPQQGFVDALVMYKWLEAHS
ncbi:MAG: N-acetyltransferase [Pseudomonadota bacterium]